MLWGRKLDMDKNVVIYPVSINFNVTVKSTRFVTEKKTKFNIDDTLYA